ncbi:MAG: 3-hydroxyisobutyrate dehydrogenase [Nocardioidaceae bacterium]|nr:3-hydroxyisobutyrate dehydrogenase [Nocardioidaceae bacterium]
MRVAVLGIGIMGAGTAQSLVREGHEVVVWNRTAAKAQAVAGAGITAVEDVATAVTGSDVVITVLFDLDAVLAVTEQLVGALGPEAVWLQVSTIGPDGVRQVARAAGPAAARLVDAPVLGTRKPAEDGTLVVLASGVEAAIDAAGPALDAVGARTLRVGDEIGLASALKLACNSWVGLITAGTAQALGLAEAQGVDPALFLDAIQGGAVDSPYAHLKGPAMLARDFGAVSFAVDGVRKDTALMVEVARANGFPSDLLETVLGLYDRASERGHGAADMGAVRAAFDA